MSAMERAGDTGGAEGLSRADLEAQLAMVQRLAKNMPLYAGTGRLGIHDVVSADVFASDYHLRNQGIAPPSPGTSEFIDGSVKSPNLASKTGAAVVDQAMQQPSTQSEGPAIQASALAA